MTEKRLQVLGKIHNYVTQAGPAPHEQLHEEGLVFVALDSRSFPYWHGDTDNGQWILRRVANKLPELQPWPETGWMFKNEAQARQAYQTVRQHILSRLPGVQVREDKSPERELLDPNVAWGEAFTWKGHEHVFLACDRTTDALSMTLTTPALTSFAVDEIPQVRCASYCTQVSDCYLAAAMASNGVADHVLVVFSPDDEVSLIESGLPGAENDGTAESFEIDVPSGILVVSWGRVPGAPLFAQFAGQDPAAVIHGFLASSIVKPIPTAFDSRSDGPVAYAVRVNPGVYDVDYWFLDTENGVSCMVLSRKGAEDFQPSVVDASSYEGLTLDQYAEVHIQRDEIIMKHGYSVGTAIAGALGGGGALPELKALAKRYNLRDNMDLKYICRVKMWDDLVLNTGGPMSQKWMESQARARMRLQGIDPNSAEGKAQMEWHARAAPQQAGPGAAPVMSGAVLEQEKARQAAAAQQAAGDGDPDPTVFPGQKLPKLSDYVKLMKGMQTGDMNGALKKAGLDMGSYMQVAQQWGMKLATDPVLTQKFGKMMAG